MISIKMRNLKERQNDIFNLQSLGFSQSSSFRSSHPEVFYRKIVLNNFGKFTEVPESCFNKVASLTLIKIDSDTRVFL